MKSKKSIDLISMLLEKVKYQVAKDTGGRGRNDISHGTRF